MEADSKRVQTIIGEMGLWVDSKGSDSPLPKDYGPNRRYCELPCARSG